jgi:hypothetical protein
MSLFISKFLSNVISIARSKMSLNTALKHSALMCLRVWISLCVILFAAISAHAYIPPYWMIMSRTADNHGKSSYLINQDIVFSHGDEALVVNERWTILNENSMRVEVTGKQQLRDKIRITYIYHNNKRYFLDETGARKSEKIPADFFEPYFHFRLSKNIKPLLVSQNIAPAVSLKSEPHRYSAKNPTPTLEPYVRLARSGGVVTYAIGNPTPVSSETASPGLWIEQDQFVIRKIRLPSALEVVAQNYTSYSQGLWLPQVRHVSWGNQTAQVQLVGVNSISQGPKLKSSLEPSALTDTKEPVQPSQWPEDTIIREFYTRMR